MSLLEDSELSHPFLEQSKVVMLMLLRNIDNLKIEKKFTRTIQFKLTERKIIDWESTNASNILWNVYFDWPIIFYTHIIFVTAQHVLSHLEFKHVKVIKIFTLKSIVSKYLYTIINSPLNYRQTILATTTLNGEQSIPLCYCTLVVSISILDLSIFGCVK